MESFFLSETTKYLFLLFANTTDLPNHYVFTTEGHLLPPFPVQDQPSALSTASQAQQAVCDAAAASPSHAASETASTAASAAGAASETASTAASASEIGSTAASASGTASVAPLQSRFDTFLRRWLPGHGWKIVPEKVVNKPSTSPGETRVNAAAWEVAAAKCEQLCGDVSEEESALRRQELQVALPMVAIEAGDAALLR